MLQRVLARLAWVLVVVAVLNGVAGLCLAALRAADLVSGSWTLILSPIWVPLAIASILVVLIVADTIWATCCAAVTTQFRARAF